MLTAILLISISAFTHAGWNLLCKTRSSSGAFFLGITLCTLAGCLPALWFCMPSAALPRHFYLITLLTGLLQTGYYIGLARIYRTSEISVGYPLVRALPVLLVPVITGLCGFGKPVSPPAVFGMTVIFAGCLILPQKRVRDLRDFRFRGFGTILLTALCIAGYTIADREALRILSFPAYGMSKGGSAYFFSLAETCGILVFFLPYVLCRKAERRELRRLCRSEWWLPVLAAVMCSGGYMLVLAAMQFTSNVSYIVAFRQLSIPAGAIAGILFLKESRSVAKWIGMGLIFSGLVLTAVF